MSSSESMAAFNRVLSEVIDLVQDVKQARRRTPAADGLHAELDDLLSDLGSWARLLVEEDETMGVSPLASMPSVAGRTPTNLWPGTASEEEIRRVVGDHLDVLKKQVAVALDNQDDDGVRDALTEVERGILKHRQRLSNL